MTILQVLHSLIAQLQQCLLISAILVVELFYPVRRLQFLKMQLINYHNGYNTHCDLHLVHASLVQNPARSREPASPSTSEADLIEHRIRISQPIAMQH